ncbi:helix-turn-helix domain-containing protein [Amycolatopsis sp.]|uniref:PucR family transcriptional regulator n=1 Tax=Amycolatopsis sp. TaxID=37632 RepID=UPI002C1C3571|nr:helix-turn-helix domain-containing protein [Amycolatopsis sp.]HVV08244.1 helix-turn-helix domain-containing protein [Amycolatopsis sp.]
MSGGDNLLAVVAERLRRRSDDLVERQLKTLRGFGSYDRVPADDLRRSCLRNVARVVATLEQHDRLPPDIEEDERISGRRRALQGVPAEDVVEAYRAVLSVLRDAFIEEAAAAAADPWEVLTGTRRLWDLTDRYSNILVSARQQVEIDAARRDERNRIAFLQRLLVGGVDPAELRAGGAVHGVLPGHRYWVLRGRQHSGEPQLLSRHLESARAGARPLVAPLDDDVAGISAARPVPLDSAVIAVAGPVPLSGVPQAFAEATRVLDVALRYGRTGVVDSSSLSVRVAVEQHGEIGEQLFRRYVAGLGEGAGSAEILLTVQAFLRERRSVAATARALSVHENTVRYRLDRYHTLTGADLADTDVLVEVWWALEYASIRR